MNLWFKMPDLRWAFTINVCYNVNSLLILTLIGWLLTFLPRLYWLDIYSQIWVSFPKCVNTPANSERNIMQMPVICKSELSLRGMIVKHAGVCFGRGKYQFMWVFLFSSSLNLNIWFVHLLQQLQQRISGTVKGTNPGQIYTGLYWIFSS